jgi:hypothetical protein
VSLLFLQIDTFPAYSGFCAEGERLSPSAARGSPEGLTAADEVRFSEKAGKGSKR